MSHQTQTQRRTHFVGDKTFDGEDDSKAGSHSWEFHHPIDHQKISIGMEFTIMRYHPLHQESLDSHLGNRTTHPQVELLVGKVLGMRRAKSGIVAFTAINRINGELTVVNIPAAFTAINPDGGWYTKAIPLKIKKGLTLRYPTKITAGDLQTPKKEKSEKSSS